MSTSSNSPVSGSKIGRREAGFGSLGRSRAGAPSRPSDGALTATTQLRISIPEVEIEILSWVVAVSAPSEGRLGAPARERPSEPKPASRRPIFDPDTGEFEEVDIYWRPDLAPGARISGPAVIAEAETSTVVSPLFDARIDEFGYIELTRNEA